MNILVGEEGLVFIEGYLSTFHVVMMIFVREYISSAVCRMPKDILVD